MYFVEISFVIYMTFDLNLFHPIQSTYRQIKADSFCLCLYNILYFVWLKHYVKKYSLTVDFVLILV